MKSSVCSIRPSFCFPLTAKSKRKGKKKDKKGREKEKKNPTNFNCPKMLIPTTKACVSRRKVLSCAAAQPRFCFRGLLNSQGRGARATTTTAAAAAANTRLLVACSFENKPRLFLLRQPQTEVATKALNPLEIPF